MCVIIYKPSGSELPNEKTLRKNFKANPDGAGYMLPLNGKVLIRKGFMTFEDFMIDLIDVIDENGIDSTATPIVLHFRITTQGGIQKELCHPFPICRDYKKMRKLSQTCDIALAHNGIISHCSSSMYNMHYDAELGHYVYGSERKISYNDTMTYIKDYASLIINGDLNFAKNPAKTELLERTVGGTNKLAIMNGNGNVHLVGDFKEKDGCYYSNLNAFTDYDRHYTYANYKPYKYASASAHTKGGE